MEMRNTEQLLASIGLMAYKVDSLPEANDALRGYGPESFHGDRITLKKKAGQESAVSKHNIHVSSMSGKFTVVNYWKVSKVNVSVEAYIYVQDQGITITPFFKLLQKPVSLKFTVPY